MGSNKIKEMMFCGLAMAIVFIMTVFISIPIGQFGYVNVGDGGVLLFSTFLHPFFAFLGAGIGSAMADLYLGYSQYAIFTFLIKGFEGLIVSIFFHFLKNRIQYVSFVIAIVWMILGYYLTDALLYGDFIVALGGIGFNAIQGFISLMIALLLHPILGKIKNKSNT